MKIHPASDGRQRVVQIVAVAVDFERNKQPARQAGRRASQRAMNERRTDWGMDGPTNNGQFVAVASKSERNRKMPWQAFVLDWFL